jgi:hypothetical protein
MGPGGKWGGGRWSSTLYGHFGSKMAAVHVLNSVPELVFPQETMACVTGRPLAHSFFLTMTVR